MSVMLIMGSCLAASGMGYPSNRGSPEPTSKPPQGELVINQEEADEWSEPGLTALAIQANEVGPVLMMEIAPQAEIPRDRNILAATAEGERNGPYGPKLAVTAALTSIIQSPTVRNERMGPYAPELAVAHVSSAVVSKGGGRFAAQL